jgi:GAF domain
VGNDEDVRARLGEAVVVSDGSLAVADRLCAACVDLLDVDGAALSVIHAGASTGTLGASNELSKRLDDFQFTFGEGPCLDAVRDGLPVCAPDLRDPNEQRWPAFAGAVLDAGVQAVFALPVSIAAERIGALDLFRSDAGPLTEAAFEGGLLAAQLAALPLLSLLRENIGWRRAGNDSDAASDGWKQLSAIARIEVYQATGMLVAQLGIGPVAALLRLRAHAFAYDLTASEVAWGIIERRVVLEPDASYPPDSGETRP